jgi:hypothetical protein
MLTLFAVGHWPKADAAMAVEFLLSGKSDVKTMSCLIVTRSGRSTHRRVGTLTYLGRDTQHQCLLQSNRDKIRRL